MNDQLLEIKPKSSKTMIMFELIEDEHDKNGGKHKQAAFDFIKTIDCFKIVQPKHINKVYIDDIGFDLDVKSCSYMAKNGWTREWKPRANRRAVLSIGYGSGHINIPVNKLIDKELLCKRIRKMIDSVNERVKAHADKQAVKQKAAEILFNKYKGLEGFTGVGVNKGGELAVHTEIGVFFVDQTGHVTGYSIDFPSIKTREDMLNSPKTFYDIIAAGAKTTMTIEEIGSTGVDDNTPEFWTGKNEDGSMNLH